MAFSPQRMLAWMPGSVLVALSRIDVAEKSEGRLMLSADGWSFAFDRASQVISRAGQSVAVFSAVESVDVTHFMNGKRFEWWLLSLQLRGGKTLAIGRSTDGAQVSLAGANVAAMTGKQVRVLKRPGL